MTARETGWYRTESGTVLEMDLPLLDGVAHRVKTGEIVRVQRDEESGRWVPWEAPAADDGIVLQDPKVAALQDDLAEAVGRIVELETALEVAIKERDELKASAEAAKPKPKPKAQ